ncbi:hypothetical protein BCD48_37800 [Pseudofrankia sp. BMG5.36]|nr:hypothetical protein BCD48_37800 [Pseudofrankia sp. BMG5.36]
MIVGFRSAGREELDWRSEWHLQKPVFTVKRRLRARFEVDKPSDVVESQLFRREHGAVECSKGTALGIGLTDTQP